MERFSVPLSRKSLIRFACCCPLGDAKLPPPGTALRHAIFSIIDAYQRPRRNAQVVGVGVNLEPSPDDGERLASREPA